MQFEMTAVPKGQPRRWTAHIDMRRTGGWFRKKSRILDFLELSSQWGTLRYGKRPEGYDSWTWEFEGGAVTMPYCVHPAGLLVGLLKEDRPNLGGSTWCAIGGMIDPGETADEAQAREAEEESKLTLRAVELKGLPFVADRLFFIADPRTGKGCNRVYGMEIPLEMLEHVEENEWKIKSLGKFKRPDDVRLFPWRHAVTITVDGIARAAIAQLLAEKL